MDAEQDLRARFQTDAAIEQARDTLLKHVSHRADREAIREIVDRTIDGEGSA